MGGLYNMVNGYNPACVFILPMLGRKAEEYPRFRDCYVTEEDTIAVYTRVGGGNRNQGFGEEKLYQDPNFIKTYDDDFDNTYATYEFSVPDKWKDDYDKICEGKFNEVSKEYIDVIKQMYPKLTESGIIDSIFNKE